MKKAIATILLVLFLTTNTSFGELLRLPTLLHHYLEHVEWDNYSFVEFVNTHYTKGISHPDDKHHDHEKLPFKTFGCNAIHILGFVPQLPLSVSSNLAELKLEFTINRNSQHYSNNNLGSVWQPPRFS